MKNNQTKLFSSIGNGRKKYAKFQRLSWETKRKYAVPEKLCLEILEVICKEKK